MAAIFFYHHYLSRDSEKPVNCFSTHTHKPTKNPTKEFYVYIKCFKSWRFCRTYII